MKKIARFSMMAACALTLSACAKAPTEDITASQEAIRKAQDADAEVYATGSLRDADAAMQRLEAELSAQDGKFPLFRNYDQARVLAEEVKATAEAAAADADREKEEMRTQTQQLLEETRTSLAGVRQLILEAPRGKDSEADLKMLEADVNGIENSLSEVESALAAGRVMDALSRTQAAHQGAAEISSELESAMVARAAATPNNKTLQKKS